MAVTLVSCYFFPFLLFFLAQLALPKSGLTFVLGVAGVTLSTLILYFQIKERPVIIKREPVLVQEPKEPEKPKVCVRGHMPSFTFDSIKRLLPSKPGCKLPNVKELEKKLLFLQEQLAQKEQLILALQKAEGQSLQLLSEKEGLIHKQEQELSNLRFEMYTILRIDSYKPSESEKLVTA